MRGKSNFTKNMSVLCNVRVTTFKTNSSYKPHCGLKHHLFNTLKEENEFLKKENKKLQEELTQLRTQKAESMPSLFASLSNVDKEVPYPPSNTKENDVKQFKQLQKEFSREIYGYHLLNDYPIKESTWEVINKNIVGKKFKIDYEHGHHGSGMDMKMGEIFVSNKSAKIQKNGHISLSSYRLTTVTNPKHPNTPESIIAEIEKRDCSFDYYAILLRSETDEHIMYYWCMIPKTHVIFDVSNQTLHKKTNKRGKMTGWTSEHASISFSMSSQLWFHFNLKDIQEYILHTCQVSRKNTITYADMYSILQVQ